ncbi:hypothetical protein AALP_AA7G098100 [Arabis alpina]|uniref:Uncharacterized protein n=1 Tax=Arabis alpina TaxID=50452 RepID=A0A087GH14_ARAAL|nr:hypothetical protein AALP_AA7G098100 [Arabis alpina]
MPDSSLDDEVFPVVNILDTSVDNEDTSKDDVASKKDEDGSHETAEINSNDKRKLPETETEKRELIKWYKDEKNEKPQRAECKTDVSAHVRCDRFMSGCSTKTQQC